MCKKRILYVEDNLQNKRLVFKILTAKGFEVLEATDGLAGVALALRERPDLILMDINLPGIDGMEATSRLKGSEISHIPIIALTANAMRGDREKIMAAGCDEYMQKPISNALLIETVIRFVGAPTSATPPPITTTAPAASMPTEAPQIPPAVSSQPPVEAV